MYSCGGGGGCFKYLLCERGRDRAEVGGRGDGVCVFVYFSILLDVIVLMLASRCDCES